MSDDEGSLRSVGDDDEDDIGSVGQDDLAHDGEDESPSNDVNAFRGSLPLILSAPHGGENDGDEKHHGRDISDAKTMQLANRMSKKIAELTGGHHPYLVVNKLHRKYLDPNRKKGDEACCGDQSEQAYDDYHHMLHKYCEEARKHNDHEVSLLVDLHGCAGDEIQLGHLVKADDLRNSKYADLKLPKTDLSMLSSKGHPAWIRGKDSSLGSMLQAQGLVASPSSENPSPRKPYFRGGHITNSCRKKGKVLTIQIEFPKAYRTPLQNRNEAADKTAVALVDFMKTWNLL